MPHGRLIAVAVLALTLGGGLAHAASEGRAEPRSHAAAKRIAVEDDFFSPKSSRARRGKVTFSWGGSVIHNVVFRRAPGPNPRGCAVRRRGTCTRSLKRRGTYSFVCTVHPPAMRGSIRVR